MERQNATSEQRIPFLFLTREAGEGDHAKHGGGGFLKIAS
jgi:hypothetical protein